MQSKSVLFEIKSLEQEIVRFIFSDIKLPDSLKMLSPTQMQIIDYILKNQNQNIYQKDLEQVLNLRRATVSGVLCTMEKNNLITRVINENDTRVKKIILNDNLKQNLQKHIKEIMKWENKIIKDISKEDMQIFIKVIKQMKKNIEYINN